MLKRTKSETNRLRVLATKLKDWIQNCWTPYLSTPFGVEKLIPNRHQAFIAEKIKHYMRSISFTTWAPPERRKAEILPIEHEKKKDVLLTAIRKHVTLGPCLSTRLLDQIWCSPSPALSVDLSHNTLGSRWRSIAIILVWS